MLALKTIKIDNLFWHIFFLYSLIIFHLIITKVFNYKLNSIIIIIIASLGTSWTYLDYCAYAQLAQATTVATITIDSKTKIPRESNSTIYPLASSKRAFESSAWKTMCASAVLSDLSLLQNYYSSLHFQALVSLAIITILQLHLPQQQSMALSYY